MIGVVEAIQGVVGSRGVLTGEDVSQRIISPFENKSCEVLAIIRPSSTDELSRVMQLCHKHGQPVVPLGGMTGVVGGAVAKPSDIAISLERMTAIEVFDNEAGTLTVQAGVPLQRVQERAEEEGWLFALDLGGRGSATIGGNIATNAGGNSVLRYGMMREQVLGVEAVLADGTVISSMNRMLKNNAGYDLKQLFIGTEGTLGIVTRAVLRLRPLPRSTQTAFVALENFGNVSALLHRVQRELNSNLSSFEVMWNNFYHLQVEESGKHQAFLPTNYPFYVILESRGSDPERDEEQFVSVLGNLLEDGTVIDAVIAGSKAQAEQIWAMRDDFEPAIKTMSPIIPYDVSMVIPDMESYVEDVLNSLKAQWPGARALVFGHLGDGNLHLVVTVGDGSESARRAVNDVVYKRLAQIGGSISAEHGIGLEKKDYLTYSRTDAEINLMKCLKAALDPKNILNPGKVI
jgi:FAD/FMN-containing dehydrogenase